MMVRYVEESDEELRRKSNRTFCRILASLPLDDSTTYDYEERPSDRLIENIDLARSREDWAEMAKLASELDDLQSEAAETQSGANW